MLKMATMRSSNDLKATSLSSTLERKMHHLDEAIPIRGYSRQGKSPERPHQVNSLPKPSSMPSNRSASIPISNSIRRTSSETQLQQEEAEADYKDYLFYSRVVHGIRQQSLQNNGYLKYETQMCLNSIVNTRHADIQKQQQSEWEDKLAEMGYFDGAQYQADPAVPTHESSDDGIFVLDL